MDPPLAGVVRLAAASRALVLALSLLARLLFRPYDTSASLHPPCLSSSSSSSPADPVSAAVSALAVWDGVHFARAAQCGYEYEQSFAFLPLLPASLALLARSLFAPLVPVLGYRAVLVISGYVLNNVAFVSAAAYFYRLSALILKDRKTAYRASVLFCFNPASVFYSSLYSESLYALFSLGGLFYLFSGANTVAMIMLALSGSARSNGALNAGYFCFQALLKAYDAAVQKKRPLGGVGFLRYFQVKQLPNFLLASPVLSLAVYSIVHYTKILHQLIQSSSIHKQIIAAVEARSVQWYKSSDVSTVLKSELSGELSNKSQGHPNVKQRKAAATEIASASVHDTMSSRDEQDQCSFLLLPFVLHLAFMTFTAFFVMHVQCRHDFYPLVLQFIGLLHTYCRRPAPLPRDGAI
ncbi:hypothetical protein ACP4OV_028097 [Aristida adscensionis]